ncbi:Hypothetical protein (Fragment) [Durusdinium trenchii]|uniref:At4g15545-like C-terminal domain-containing protein n=1 Tax=Durusdinium trenchii TaxID=1381693 RepID=A0ABP0K5P0_9DINO
MAHDPLCGKIDPSKVGPGKCKMGCSLPVATGRDSSGLALDTCCRGCARGEGHDDQCGKEVGAVAIPYAAIDASEAFFQKARQELDTVQYNQLIQEIRQLNRKSQSVEECLEKSSALMSPALLAELRHLILRSKAQPHLETVRKQSSFLRRNRSRKMLSTQFLYCVMAFATIHLSSSQEM